ncbi:MAG: rod shape-determining protein [Lachnospiraceae bacterium]|nr:rod shape-determining protein [Lachnospiraceae bacterium]MDE6625782.1 rod shape-determining protein [Lachnospiraceae bacterium]
MTKNAPADITIYVKDKGITLREKSLIAISGSKIIAYGNECEYVQADSATEQEVKVLSPFKQGKITDFSCAVAMLKYFVRKARGNKRIWRKPTIGIIVPEDISLVDQKAYEDAIYMLTAKSVYFFHEPLETIIRDLSVEYKKKIDIIIGIEVNPLEYIQETISDLLTFCEKNSISKETVIELLSETGRSL